MYKQTLITNKNNVFTSNEISVVVKFYWNAIRMKKGSWDSICFHR